MSLSSTFTHTHKKITHCHFDHHQIPHKLVWEHTQSSTVTGWQLTVWGMALLPLYMFILLRATFFPPTAQQPL